MRLPKTLEKIIGVLTIAGLSLIPLKKANADIYFYGNAGLEMGGIPIATALSLQTGLPVVFVRKQAKEYGTCKLAEGTDIAGKKLCVIEDVITTGGQVILSTNDLRGFGAEVQHVLCVIERGENSKEILGKEGLTLSSLFTMAELKASVSE